MIWGYHHFRKPPYRFFKDSCTSRGFWRVEALTYATSFGARHSKSPSFERLKIPALIHHQLREGVWYVEIPGNFTRSFWFLHPKGWWFPGGFSRISKKHQRRIKQTPTTWTWFDLTDDWSTKLPETNSNSTCQGPFIQKGNDHLPVPSILRCEQLLLFSGRVINVIIQVFSKTIAAQRSANG